MSKRLRSSNLTIIRSIALTFDFTVSLRCASQLSLLGAARLSIKSEANEDEVKRVCAHNEHFRDYNALNKTLILLITITEMIFKMLASCGFESFLELFRRLLVGGMSRCPTRVSSLLLTQSIPNEVPSGRRTVVEKIE